MPDISPIEVPEGLRPLLAHRPDAIDALRAARLALQEGSGHGPVEVEMLTLAALVALGAPADAIAVHVARARALGTSERAVWGVLEVIAVVVGVPRVVAAAPMVARALEEAPA